MIIIDATWPMLHNARLTATQADKFTVFVLFRVTSFITLSSSAFVFTLQFYFQAFSIILYYNISFDKSLHTALYFLTVVVAFQHTFRHCFDSRMSYALQALVFIISYCA